jgi:GAF domain-containing protein
MQMTERNEEVRLAALHQFGIIQTGPEQAYDELARTAATICQTPVALVDFVDQDRVWVKAHVGTDVTDWPRTQSLSAQAILDNDVLIVPDAVADERFAAAAPVISGQQIRFYAGMPLVTSAGQAVGTLCVLDFQPRELTRQQVEWLRLLSKEVVQQLESRLDVADAAHLRTALDEHAGLLKAAEDALRQRVNALRQFNAGHEETQAARAAQLTGLLGQFQQEINARTRLEGVVKDREDELSLLRAQLADVTMERSSEVGRLNEQLAQETAGRQRAEQALLNREGEWTNHRSHLEGIIAEQTAALTRINELLQQKDAELAQTKDALTQRDEQLRKVEQGLTDMAQIVRRELERYVPA